MQLTKHFDVPKKRPFHGWAGVITEWPLEAAPKVDFGKWTRDLGTVKFDCVPFQLCMFGANSKEMNSGDKFTYFAFAGLGTDGSLVLQLLPEGTNAREVFAVGGWTPPDIEDLVNKVNRAGTSVIEGMPPAQHLGMEFNALLLESARGFGMGLGDRPNEQRFFNVLASWPQLAPLHVAFLAQREKLAKMVAENRANSLEAKRARLEKVLAEMRADNLEITSVTAASKILGIVLMADVEIPHKVKDAARRLRKDFGYHFIEEVR